MIFVISMIVISTYVFVQNRIKACLLIKILSFQRANRLFFTEARHFAPGVKDYTYTDAQEAVKAIRETDYETDDPTVLLAIVKTLKDADDIRDYLKRMSQKNKERVNSKRIAVANLDY